MPDDVPDLDWRLDALTRDATRGLAAPPVTQVHRRARAARRGQAIGGAAATMAVVAIVATVVSGAPDDQRGGQVAAPATSAAGPSPADESSAAAASSSPADDTSAAGSSEMSPTADPSLLALPSPVPSLGPPDDPTSAAKSAPPTRPEQLPESALLTAEDVSVELGDEAVSVDPVDFSPYDPCGRGLQPSGSGIGVMYSSESGQVSQQLSSHGGDLAARHVDAMTQETRECATGGGTTYKMLEPLDVGDASLVVTTGGPKDPIQTYIVLAAAGPTLMELHIVRLGTDYTEREARGLARKAFDKVVAATDPDESGGPDGSIAPGAFIDRPKLRACGTHTVESGPADPSSAPARMTKCMADAMRSGTGAGLVAVSQDVDGAPVATYYRAVPGQPGLEIFQVVEAATGDDAYAARFTMRRCPQAASVTKLGTCTEKKL